MQKYAENALWNTTGTLNTAKRNWKGISAFCFSLTSAPLGNGGLDITLMTFWTFYTLLVKLAHTFYSASNLTVHKPSWKNPLNNFFFPTVLYFFIINGFQSMGCEHHSHYFSWTELLLLELSAPAVPRKSKNKWICCSLVRLLNSCGAHSCSSVSYTSSAGLNQRRSSLLPCSCRERFWSSSLFLGTGQETCLYLLTMQ